MRCTRSPGWGTFCLLLLDNNLYACLYGMPIGQKDRRNAPTESVLFTLVIEDASEKGDSSRSNTGFPGPAGGVCGGDIGNSIGFGP